MYFLKYDLYKTIFMTFLCFVNLKRENKHTLLINRLKLLARKKGYTQETYLVYFYLRDKKFKYIV